MRIQGHKVKHPTLKRILFDLDIRLSYRAILKAERIRFYEHLMSDLIELDKEIAS